MAAPDRWMRQPQVRGAWRCSLCNINFPNDRDRFKVCLACGDECSYMSNAKPHDDWQDQVVENIMRWEGGDHNTIPTDWFIPPSKEAEGEGEA